MKTADKAKPAASSSKPVSSPFFNKEAGNGLYDSENPSFFQPSSPFIQSKPDPGQPVEREQEPDSTLDQVLQERGIGRPENAPFFKAETSPTPSIQTKCADCEEEQVQKKEEVEEEVSLQKKSIFESNDDPANAVQAKLTVGQHGDKYEQEADAVADQVVQNLAQSEGAHSPAIGDTPHAPSISPFVQKQTEKSEQEELQKKEESEEDLNLQRKEIYENNDFQDKLQMKCADCENKEQSQVMAKESGGGKNNTENLEQHLQSSSGDGESLSPETKDQMGSAFGTDFSKVNIHTGSDAVQMNKQLGAQAFTHGNNIYFNEGKYNPGSSDGNRLLAHELTHTVQQGKHSGLSVKLQRKEQVTANLPEPYSWPGSHAANNENEFLANIILDRFYEDPADSKGRVKRRINNLTPDQRQFLIRRIEGQLSSEKLGLFQALLEEPVPTSSPVEKSTANYSDSNVYNGGDPIPVIDAQSESIKGNGISAVESPKGNDLQAKENEAQGQTEDHKKEETSDLKAPEVSQDSGKKAIPKVGKKKDKSTSNTPFPTKGVAKQSTDFNPPSLNPYIGINISLPPGYVRQQPDLTTEKAFNVQVFQQRFQKSISQAKLQAIDYQNNSFLQLQMAIDQERERIRVGCSIARQQVRSSFDTAKSTANNNAIAAQGEILALIANYKEQILATEEFKKQELEIGKETAIQQVNAANVNYENQCDSLGIREAERSRSDASGKAEIVREIGRRREMAATGDTELKELKREGIAEITNKTIEHILEVGSETAVGVEGMALEAKGQFSEGISVKITEIEDFHVLALEKLPEMSTAVLQVYGNLENQVPLIIMEIIDGILKELESGQTAALESIDQAENHHFSQLDQVNSDSRLSIEVKTLSFLKQIGLIEFHYLNLLNSTDHPNDKQVEVLTIQTEQAIDGDVNAFGLMLQQAGSNLQAAIPGIGDSLESGLSDLQTNISNHSVDSLTGLNNVLESLKVQVQTELDEDFQGYEEEINTVVSETLQEYQALTTEFEVEVNNALFNLELNLIQAVDESIAHNQEEIDSLEGSGKHSEAERRAEEEYNQSWWEGFLDTLISGLLIGLLIFVAVVALVALGIITLKAALIIGLVFLAIGVITAVVQRLYSLWESGAPWYQWVIYLIVAFNPITGPAFLILDGLGMVGLVEGLAGYDFFTWQRLSGYEAGSRTGKGVVTIILLIVSFGTAKALAPRVPAVEVLPAPPRPALPPGTAPRPGVIDLVYNPKTGVWEVPGGGVSTPPQLPVPVEPALPVPVEPPLLPPASRPPLVPVPTEPPGPRPIEPELPGPRPSLEIPETWSKFDPELNGEFRPRLRSFRGNEDLSADPSLRGGEGQLFDSTLHRLQGLKRWFKSRIPDMGRSLRLLREAKDSVDSNPNLSRDLEVVDIFEEGSDWIIRDFDPDSIPLRDAVSDPEVAAARQRLIDALEGTRDPILRNVLGKLRRNSANIHWSPSRNKLIIIDMQ